MARRLCTVEDTFFIEGRGLIPVPGIIPQGEERFRIGDSLLLKRPDGSTVSSAIAGFEMIHWPLPRQDIVILLKGLAKDDVPIGTEIWSVDQSE